MMSLTTFVRGLSCLAALACTGCAAAPAAATVELGLQSWTCRKMTFEEVVAFAVDHGIHDVEFFPKHLNPRDPDGENRRKKAYLREHGITCHAYGVAKTSLDAAQNRRLFEFARLMDIRLILVAPENMAEWDGLEALAKEYDVRLAIHNEGPGTPYSDPAVVRQILRQRDRRIGVCLDVGHLTESGFDAARAFQEYDGRVYDVHLKDKRVESEGKRRVVTDTEIGRGQSDFPRLFAELKRARWSGVLTIETDSPAFAANPGHFVDEAVAFVRKNFPDGTERR